jgi:putative tryptophan/tyrosine transport system substrate-binding protein
MRRRTLLLGLIGTAIGPRGRLARAQTQALPVVGLLRTSANDSVFETQFRQDMKGLGWHDGRNVQFDFRWSDGTVERMPQLADELVAGRPKVLLGFGPVAIRALQAVTRDIPIVGMSDDLVASRLAGAMSRPGGNTTGVSIFAAELDAKRLELLRELLPGARSVGVLYDPRVTIDRGEQLDAPARALGLALVLVAADSIETVGPAIDTLIAARVDAVNVLASSILNSARAITIERLRQARLPGIHQWPETAQEGGLLAYGPSLRAIYRQLVVFTDKILRGAQPATLPIEHPTKLDLVVNLRAARAIGIDVPATLLARADEVIE